MCEEKIKQYLLNRLSSAEAAELEKWILESEENAQFFADYKNTWSLAVMDEVLVDDVYLSKEYGKLFDKIDSAKQRRTIRFSGLLKYAALFVLLIGVVFVFRLYIDRKMGISNMATAVSKIKPGSSKAVLVMADGRSVLLNSASNGALFMNGDMRVGRLAKGKLEYNQQLPTENVRLNGAYNKLIVPRGGEYKLTLSDGTEVWLNSESRLEYPVLFTEKTREVRLRGEAYFEVAKNASKPFLVRINDKAIVRVLGTHFNISAYDDESDIKVTLLEGSVKVSSLIKDHSVSIKPGQQVRLSQKGEIIATDVNTDDVIAWKNGNFLFDHESLESIMKKLSRWYNIEVIYRDPQLKNIQFFGIIRRYEDISSILEMLKLTKEVKFEVKNNNVMVYTVNPKN